MPQMLQRLRRASHQLPGRRKSSIASEASNSDQRPTTTIPERASFFSLPPEIRNQIYEELAVDTNLSLTPRVSRKRGADPPGLLLACRQTYQEYRPVLLSSATMQIFVSDYNFGNVIRVLEKLVEGDVDLLRANGNLWIVLRLGHVPSREDKKSLQAWNDYRSGQTKPYFKQGSMDARVLTFKYDALFLQNMRPPRPASRYTNGYAMRHDLLRSHVRMYRELNNNPQCVVRDNAGTWEIQHLLADMEQHSQILAELRGDTTNDAILAASRATSVVSQLTTIGMT